MKPQERQITSCRARAGQHARPSHKHCKARAQHAHAPPPRECTRLHDFHLVEFSHQPVPSQRNNELKQQGDGAGETSITTNYELQGTGWATRAPVAQTLQSVCQTCPCTTATCSYTFARFPTCCFTGLVRVGVKIPQDGNRANRYEHVAVVHGHVWRTLCSVCATNARVARPVFCNS